MSSRKTPHLRDGQSTADLVREHLSHDIIMEGARARGYLSRRAAARWIIREYDLEKSLDSVVSALRRDSEPPRVNLREGYELLSEVTCHARTGMSVIAVPKVPSMRNQIPKVEELCKTDPFFARIEGEDVVWLVLAAWNAEKAIEIVEEDHRRQEGAAFRMKRFRAEKRDDVCTLVLSFEKRGKEATAAATVLMNLLMQQGLDPIGMHLMEENVVFLFPEEDWARANKLVRKAKEIGETARKAGGGQ